MVGLTRHWVTLIGRTNIRIILCGNCGMHRLTSDTGISRTGVVVININPLAGIRNNHLTPTSAASTHGTTRTIRATAPTPPSTCNRTASATTTYGATTSTTGSSNAGPSIAGSTTASRTFGISRRCPGGIIGGRLGIGLFGFVSRSGLFRGCGRVILRRLIGRPGTAGHHK